MKSRTYATLLMVGFTCVGGSSVYAQEEGGDVAGGGDDTGSLYRILGQDEGGAGAVDQEFADGGLRTDYNGRM